MNKFVIIAESRSGYQMLAMALSSNPDIFCFGEIFGCDRGIRIASLFEKKFRPIEDKEHPSNYLNDLYNFASKIKLNSVGFKLNYVDARQQNWKDLWNIIRDEDFKIIHLKRKNLLNRYLSSKLAGHEKCWINKPYKSRIKIPPFEFSNSFALSYRWRDEIHSFFKGASMKEVWYEDIVSDSDFHLREIQEFLGVKPKNLTITTKKQRQDSQSWLLGNYKEVYRYMIRSFPDFLEDILFL